MARTARNEMLRKIDQAINDQDRYIANLRWLGEKYSEQHPNHTTMCLRMVEAAENLKGMTLRFRQEMM